MNEQRQQAYLDLIERLLNCLSGEEPDILEASQDLLDADFLQMLEAVAEEQGDENAASWLINLANQLREALNLSSPTVANISEDELQAHRQFLMEVLQAIAESEGEAQLVYPLLEKNTTYLNLTLAELLRRWATNKLAEVETDEAPSIALSIAYFSYLIQQFPLGNKASNMEIAIAGYEVVLTVFTFEAFPQDWARTQNNLGNAYLERIFGEKAENIELAIAYFTNFLEVYTRDASPEEWAWMQNSLGANYCDGIFGEKAENIELAITYFTKALSVRTFDAFPEEWAQTQFHLGNAYRKRIVGEKAENIESAIASYTKALSVLTRDAFPQNWATTQSNLGAAYSERIVGEKAENIEWAIKSFNKALSVLTKDAFRQDWANTQYNLGIAYSQRIVGEKAENIELAIASYTNALSVFTFDAFRQQWANTQYNLGIAYGKRIVGEKAENIELAIASYTNALSVFTFDAFRQQWADTQNNLGNAYGKRIVGEKAENLELAIASYTNALSVFTFDAFRQQWADTQNNLGAAYGKRINGEKAENLELAITYFTNALSVFTFDAFPQQWADTQNNLGAAYGKRINGEKAENLELAITYFTNALSVFTFDAFRQQWADTQNNLGNAYGERINGEKAENLELAIASYTNALSVFTFDAFRQQWADTQNNLGNAYGERIVGEKAENRELAIASYTNALSVFTFDAFRQQWADTQNNLGNAYGERIVGEKAENRELAIASYTNALSVYTEDAFPQDWARTQYNLGNAYGERIVGEKAENLELAIASYTNALSVYTFDAFPQHWAYTQNNLGNAYGERIVGDKAENRELAIASYTNALKVFTFDAFPQNHAQTLFNLGSLYQDAQRLTDAYTNFDSAIKTAEFLRGEIVSGDEIKRKQAEEWNRVYRRMVEVCLEFKKSTEAIEYVERSKTRNLVELLFCPDLYPKLAISEEFKNQRQQLQQEIEEEKRRVEQAEKSNPQDINRARLNNLRQKREQLITRIISLNPISYDEIHNLLDKKTAIIQFYIFDNCFRAFIITRHNEQPEIWQSQPEDLEKLVNWINEYLPLYFEHKKLWRHCLNEKLSQLAEILHIQEILSLVPQECKKVILIPHRHLHLLPLHALPLSSEEYLIDKFSNGVSYAPSCQLWRVTQTKAKTLFNSQFHHLFAIQNPTDNLEYTDIEVETIAAAFHSRHILKKSEATAQALKEPTTSENFRKANWLHFSCHGYFNFELPEKSALQLAASEISPLPADAETSRYLRVSPDTEIDLKNCLTLEDIFQLNLPNCRLVTLSACETGLVDGWNTSDEYIGLPSGFIRAGAASIVSSLWAVDDFCTALLMIKFYENLQKTVTPNVPCALNQAQQWFRQVTQRELLQWLDGKTDMNAEQKQKVKERLEKYYKPEERPFKQPFSWASFSAIGE